MAGPAMTDDAYKRKNKPRGGKQTKKPWGKGGRGGKGGKPK